MKPEIRNILCFKTKTVVSNIIYNYSIYKQILFKPKSRQPWHKN